MEILVTAGGTEEPIDGVRTISNFSTGKTGAVIANTFHKNGFKVTLLTSERGVSPNENLKIIRYQSFTDLNSELETLLATGNFRGIIHAAAVSDYSVDHLISGGKSIMPDKNSKIDSSKPLSIILKPNFKILDRIKSYSSKPITVVGFKLTKNGSKELVTKRVEGLFSSKKVDYVVHNDLELIDKTKHISTIYRNNEIYAQCKTKDEMAISLVKIFKAGRCKHLLA